MPQRFRFAPLLLPALACASARTAPTSAGLPSATSNAVGCGAARVDAIEVAELVRRLASSTEAGPTKMRSDVGITAPVLTAADTVRFASEPAVCGPAAAAFARTFGPAPAGRGVLATRFGPYWLIARPDGRPRPFAMLTDDAFRQRAVWGL